MKPIKIKAELLDPTGIAYDCDAMSLEAIPNHSTRILLTIGEYVWMVLGDGKSMKRIVPPEGEPEFGLDICTECVQFTNHLDGVCQKCKKDE